MGERAIMESFNLDNSYKQKLRFLEQKYASLLSGRTDKWKENFLKKINESLSNEDKLEISGMTYELKNDGEIIGTVTDVLYNLKDEGLLGILSKITDPDKLKSIVAMLARVGKDIPNNDSEGISDNKSKKTLKHLNEFNTVLINSFLIDLEEYKQIKKSMETLEGETTEGHKNSQLFGLISKNIRSSIKDVLRKGEGFLDEEETDIDIRLPSITAQYDEDGNLIKGTSNLTNEKEGILSDSIRKNFINPIVFFHTIQRIYQKYNYVITAKEIGNLKKIFSDIKEGKMVFLTGDTGSGKTELCLLVSSLYLDEVYLDSNERKNKEPVIVTGNSETDFSDFTLEKIVTSENYLSSSDDALNREETDDVKQKEFIEKMNKSKEFKDAVKHIIKGDTSLSEDEKKEMCEQVDKEDLLEYNIFTKYHLQGMIKAMKEGVPLIIDEMNGIRPEVLLGLNHYFTRRVGQTVSLGNGFTPIEIKKGFCIMCTGNDKDENSNAKRYRGRYTIDESLMNRMHRICKGYHRQEVKGFTNENSGGFEESADMLDYLTKNELYGVILMLLFSKKENKKIDKLGKDVVDIDANLKSKYLKEFDKENASKILTHTEVAAFDIIKEEFLGNNSVEQKKKNFFQDLMKLAAFVSLVQSAFQGNTTMCSGKDVRNLMENSQGFSMRDLITIINGYKNDTKSLWYHLYNDYIKQIPEANKAREGVYLIAKEVGFLDRYLNVDSKSINDISEGIEKTLQMEKQTSGKSDDFELMDVHNKKLEISESLLADGRIIITKQDMYKEYFGNNFSDGIEINEDAINQYEQEQKDKSNDNSMEIVKDYLVDEIVSLCETILSYEEDPTYKKFFDNDKLDWRHLSILTKFCKHHKEKKNINYDQNTINELGKTLSIIENLIFSNSDYDVEKTTSLITNLQGLGQWQQE